jgi:hypothetical protein
VFASDLQRSVYTGEVHHERYVPAIGFLEIAEQFIGPAVAPQPKHSDSHAQHQRHRREDREDMPGEAAEHVGIIPHARRRAVRDDLRRESPEPLQFQPSRHAEMNIAGR